MGWFRKSGNEATSFIEWRLLKSIEDVEIYNDMSFSKPVVFFKHSTRCSISTTAKSRFERGFDYDNDEITPIYLDLLAHRDVSNFLEDLYGIQHQSPQILMIKNGECVYHTSHNAIDPDVLRDYL